MEEALRVQFITRLEAKYGPWNQATSRFGSASYGVVSKDLSISASQFSKLISGTATDGMYERSIENINRLIQNEQIRAQLQEVEAQKRQLETRLAQQRTRSGLRAALFIFAGIFAYHLGQLAAAQFGPADPLVSEALLPRAEHPLSLFFDQSSNANVQSPYLNLSEVQAYCPCNAYEGSWSLRAPYKLPLPGSRRPGLFYYGKSADVRMKCSRYDTLGIGKGQVLTAYEYLVNEIWLDTKMRPLSPRYFDNTRKAFTPEFDALDFASDPDFRKVATIHSFFTDKFEIYPDSIVRKGEPNGRYATDIDQELVDEFELNLRFILEDVLGGLTTTACSATVNPFCNPNDLKEGSVINFDCIYTIGTENLGIGGGYPYQKGYRLEDQHYSDNLVCGCDN